MFWESKIEVVCKKNSLPISTMYCDFETKDVRSTARIATISIVVKWCTYICISGYSNRKIVAAMNPQRRQKKISGYKYALLSECYTFLPL